MSATVLPRQVAVAVPRRRRAVRAFLRDRMAVAGLVLLVPVVVAALWPVAWLPHPPAWSDLDARLVPPALLAGGRWAHPLGTDNLGRDILSRMMYGGRFSLFVALSAVTLAALIGVTAGVVAGYRGGLADVIVMRLVDVQLAFPLILLVIAIIAVLGTSLPMLIVVLGVPAWAHYARIIRGSTLVVVAAQYVEAARALGGRESRLIFRHVLPNLATPMVILTTFEIARLLLLESAVSFLGLGIQPPTPSWGTMIADGRNHIYEGWWVSTIPGMGIFLVVLALNFIGDGLRDVLDPRAHARRAML
ncbi:MAG: ABC transporter permease [Armatimonadota bacterium]|nr:ABC transporter permease [Armatimonadota bacterium]MDR7422566.1 ABC transporter permease [Armatimonadota bacterium]MDR7453937.1 ABC transporter permease [Armatimonadota bacterium]MDR7495747.1 ABC transporter permease [Armatimonadota bacterium]MDR7511042.1 ABC transporter permease [Armatimonadota bacterium]